MKTFIIHIYRCEKKDAHGFLGVAQEVGHDEKIAFTNPDDLLKIMSPIAMRKETGENASP